jgi:hypothetical protein
MASSLLFDELVSFKSGGGISEDEDSNKVKINKQSGGW